MNDELKKLLFELLDYLYQNNEEEIKEWIYETYPHGIGLYDGAGEK